MQRWNLTNLGVRWHLCQVPDDDQLINNYLLSMWSTQVLSKGFKTRMSQCRVSLYNVAEVGKIRGSGAVWEDSVIQNGIG